MAEKTPILELNCPSCHGRLSARSDQLGQSVICPLCRQAFEVKPPGPAPAPASTGRLYHFQCLRCGSVLEARAHQSGQAGKCPTCGAVFTVPEIDPRTGLARSNADPGDDGENPTPVHAYAAAGTMAPKLVRHEDDTLHIECPRCNHQSPITANNCPICGLPFTMEGVSATAVLTTGSQGQTAWILAMVGFVLSFCMGIGAILGIIAIIYGVYALNDRRSPGRTAAIAGIVLGVLDCIIALVFLANL